MVFIGMVRMGGSDSALDCGNPSVVEKASTLLKLVLQQCR